MAGEASRDMACRLCWNFCEDTDGKGFKIYVWDEFRSSTLVPCNARAYVNDNAGKYMRFEAHGHKYYVDLLKLQHSTMIKGSGWKKFTSNFSLGNGDVVLFGLDVNPRQTFVYKLSGEDADETDTDDGRDDDIVEGETSDEDADGGDISIEYTRGALLSMVQEQNLNIAVSVFKSNFLGVPFVHCLTATDIEGGQMKLPPKVAASLKISKKGTAGVHLGTGFAKTRVKYITSCDGCIAFHNKDWRRFVSKTTLSVKDCIFIFFKASIKEYLDVSVVVNKL